MKSNGIRNMCCNAARSHGIEWVIVVSDERESERVREKGRGKERPMMG